MGMTFEPSDDILREYITARSEVVRLQKSQADHLKDLETRGQAQIAASHQTVPKEIVARARADRTRLTTKQVRQPRRTPTESRLAASGPSLSRGGWRALSRLGELRTRLQIVGVLTIPLVPPLTG
jgi:hypothetical protein